MLPVNKKKIIDYLNFAIRLISKDLSVWTPILQLYPTLDFSLLCSRLNCKRSYLFELIRNSIHCGLLSYNENDLHLIWLSLSFSLPLSLALSSICGLITSFYCISLANPLSSTFALHSVALWSFLYFGHNLAGCGSFRNPKSKCQMLVESSKEKESKAEKWNENTQFLSGKPQKKKTKQK